MPDEVDTASPCGVDIRPPSTDLWSWRGVGDLDLAPELGAAVELTEQDGLGARRLARATMRNITNTAPIQPIARSAEKSIDAPASMKNRIMNGH